ncbi:Hsp70 family protein [Nocardia amamiensis]|uniref:Hsp70 family protein n=1 Tax=Nocardia amamiensis TaxID=404578 RepID=UPI00082D3CA6|nr:Hsp70 family protein [Nocardia amamiensis]
MSVGTVNSVAAVVSEGVEKGVRVCRTQAAPRGANDDLPFMAEIQDSAAGASVGPIADHPVLADAEVVAAMAGYLTDGMDLHVDTVLACPAIYSAEELSALREALDAAGLARIALTPEPIAAAAWLEMQCEPDKPAVIAVYDLGGGGLDITLLRTDTDDDARIIGRPARSSAFGGRAFSTLLAHYAHDLTADTTSPGLPGQLPDAAVTGVRAGLVRSSIPLLHECVRAVGLAPADIDRILLVGGAARPAEVAQVLADELGCPVVTASDPAHCIAIGAAALAARGLGGAELLVPPRTGHPAKGVAALAGAAAVFATAGVVAMSVGDPAEPSTQQALDPRAAAPFIVAESAIPDGEQADRAGSTQPRIARWIRTDYLVGYRNSALEAVVAAPSGRPAALLESPHSTLKPATTMVESPTSDSPQLPVRPVQTSGSGVSQPGTGEAPELPSDLAIPTVGSIHPPEAPTAFHLEPVSDVGPPIASTTNTSGRSGAAAIGGSVSTPSAAGAAAGSRFATSTSSRSDGSTGGDSATRTSNRPTGSTGSDSHTASSSRISNGTGTESSASTGTNNSSRSGGDAGSHSGTSASRQTGGSTGSDSSTNAGSGSAGKTGSRAGS